jgi:L,D-transpeptidase catalytic domain
VSSGRDRVRLVAGFAAIAMAAIAVVAVAVLALSRVKLASDGTALAQVSVGPVGGTIERIRAFDPRGRSIPLAIADGRLTPLHRLHPGEQVSIEVTVRRPGWLGWALGNRSTQRLTLRAPVAQVSEHWMTVRPGTPVRVSFEQPVSAVAYGSAGEPKRHTLSGARSSISLGHMPTTGSVAIAAAPRPWETLGASTQVSWFPPSRAPVMVSLPAAGSQVGPATPIYLTFSKPIGDVLGSKRPRIVPTVPGRWRQTDSHTLAFIPSGFGAPLGSRLQIQLPRPVATSSGSASGLHSASRLEWTVPLGSTLRLQQLLAQTGYLPVLWRATGASVPRTPRAQARAAVDPPRGRFRWRYPNTPHQLRALWAAGQPGVITKGAVMKFESADGMAVDGQAGPAVWQALLKYALAGKRLDEPYSYVYVHRSLPQTMTLWSAGRTIETAPANTGITGAETELGTFPVFEHIPEGTMSGTNPDGTHYHDPGIKWISYFNGGDALHNFDRASFGTPQSLGCVELPLAVAEKEWPYTTVGTLVTIEP